MRQTRQSVLLLALFAAVPTLVAFPGCTKPVEAPTASRITIVQGHQQTGAIGTMLPTSVILRVLATDGAPIAKIPVSFNVLAGGGTVDPGTVNSDANGEVKVKWTMGNQGTVQAIAAAAPGVDPVTLSATAITPSEMVVAQGNNQTAKVGTALPVQLVIRVTGGNNVPIPGQTVAISITGGGGSITPQSSVTNALGEVTVRWTLGLQPGPQSASITAGSLGPLTVNATGS
ncbi:MAG: Ig-like domain-containing protein [Gemmatimonadota bacterium]